MASTKTTYSIESFITAGKGITISYNNLSYIETISNGTRVPFLNVIQDYMDELKSLAMTIEMNDEEYRKYTYKPKLLANDIYGNSELYFIILLINGICDVKEFTKKKLILIPKSSIEKALTMIYNSEKQALDSYNT